MVCSKSGCAFRMTAFVCPKGFHTSNEKLRIIEKKNGGLLKVSQFFGAQFCPNAQFCRCMPFGKIWWAAILVAFLPKIVESEDKPALKDVLTRKRSPFIYRCAIQYKSSCGVGGIVPMRMKVLLAGVMTVLAALLLSGCRFAVVEESPVQIGWAQNLRAQEV